MNNEEKVFTITDDNGTSITVKGNNLVFSDGFHQLHDLYNHRCTIYVQYLALIDRLVSVNTIDAVKNQRRFFIWKKLLMDNSKGYEEFTGWFLLGIGLDKGYQITYHLPQRFLVDVGFAANLDDDYSDNHDSISSVIGKQGFDIYTKDVIYEWDNHTSLDVLERLRELTEYLLDSVAY